MIVLIPARGGSKGVPDKNIKFLDGMPLVAYPILEAKKTSLIKEVYVSTDSIKIAQIAEKYGAKVIVRPSELAQDNSLDIDVFRHFVNEINYFDSIVHLRATTPLIKHSSLNKAIEYFKEKENECTSLRSAHEMSESAYKFFKKNDDYFEGLFSELKNEYYNLSRQSVPKTYKPNGYIDIVKPSVFMEGDSFHGDKILSFITEEMIEIDTIKEFEYLEYLIKKKYNE